MAVLLMRSLTTTPTFDARMRRGFSGLSVVCFSGMTSHPHRFALWPAPFGERAAVARLRPEAAAGFVAFVVPAEAAFRRGLVAGATAPADGAASRADLDASPAVAARAARPRPTGPTISLNTVFTRARSLRSSRILEGF